MGRKLFLNLLFVLNLLHLSLLAAGIRFVVAHVLPRREFPYRLPLSGYAAWVEVPGLGVVAFRRDDGRLLYRW